MYTDTVQTFVIIAGALVLSVFGQYEYNNLTADVYFSVHSPCSRVVVPALQASQQEIY